MGKKSKGTKKPKIKKSKQNLENLDLNHTADWEDDPDMLDWEDPDPCNRED